MNTDDSSKNDKLAIYRTKIGLDLLGVLGNDQRLRPTMVNDKVYLSLVNLMEVFGNSEKPSYSPREIWRDEKRRLKKRKPELWEKISQLKLVALDGKMRLTDIADLETCYRVLMYMNSPNSDQFKDLSANVMARITEAEMAYRAMNISRGFEWAADTIRAELESEGYEYPDDKTDAWSDLGYK